MVKSCSGERLKKVYFSPYFLNKEPSLVAGLARQQLAGTGIWRNPPDFRGIRSKYRNSCPVGIPEKKSVKAKEKNRNSCDPSKTTFL
jgi:hypothetical protein